MDAGPHDRIDQAPSYFSEITTYIGFGPEDSEVLRAFLPIAEPHFGRIADHFYERIVNHPQAHQAITGGPAQVERLKQTLAEWMRTAMLGPHDEDYCERRARIGHMHVRIGLPQRYMVTAMNVMRLDFSELASHAQELEQDQAKLDRLQLAIGRLCDLELAIMLETYKLEAEDRLRRRERLATIGQLAASIGHDLRNPLSVIESSLYILRRRMRDDERASKHVERISHQIGECDAIITHLLDLARNQPPRREAIDAATFIDDAIASSRVPDHFLIERAGFADRTLLVDAGLLKPALVNLLINAVQAQRHQQGPVPGEPVISIAIEVEGRDVVLSVADRGPGFELDTLPSIFEPLVTTKASGTGLGLALVKSVVERHGGHVSADNRVDGGAVVKLILPDALAPPDPRP